MFVNETELGIFNTELPKAFTERKDNANNIFKLFDIKQYFVVFFIEIPFATTDYRSNLFAWFTIQSVGAGQGWQSLNQFIIARKYI